MGHIPPLAKILPHLLGISLPWLIAGQPISQIDYDALHFVRKGAKVAQATILDIGFWG